MPSADGDILVVDDLPCMREVIRWFLEDLGFTRIREAEDGDTALAELRRCRAALVISDVRMPRMSGIELLQALRADEALRGIPVVIMTSTLTTEIEAELLAAGADAYLAKPFTAKMLEAKLNEILKNC